jgi:hypothetical protein
MGHEVFLETERRAWGQNVWEPLVYRIIRPVSGTRKENDSRDVGRYTLQFS